MTDGASDLYTWRSGQRNKKMRFDTGIDLTGFTLSVQVLQPDASSPITLSATIASDDVEVAELLVTTADFDAPGTYALAVKAVLGGQILITDQQITLEVTQIGEDAP